MNDELSPEGNERVRVALKMAREDDRRRKRQYELAERTSAELRDPLKHILDRNVLDLPVGALRCVLREASDAAILCRRAAVEFLEAFLIGFLTSPRFPLNCAALYAECSIYLFTPEYGDVVEALPKLAEVFPKEEPRPMLRVTALGKNLRGEEMPLRIAGRAVEHMLFVVPEWIRNGKPWDREFSVMRDETAVCEMDYKGTVLPVGICEHPTPLSVLRIEDVHGAKQRARTAWAFLFGDNLSLYRTAPRQESLRRKP